MMGRRRWVRDWAEAPGELAKALPLLLATACGPGSGARDLPSATVWQSTHFEYRSRASDGICPEVLGPLEDHFAALHDYLGFSWPAGAKIVYDKFADSTDFAAHATCPAEAGGCAAQTEVESAASLDDHELVHAYLYPTGFPPWVLIEGAAVALSCTARFYADGKPDLPWEQLATIQSGAADPVTAYRAGAWLTGYLLDAFGPQRFRTLYATLPHDASARAISAACERIYGQPLSSLWAAALAEDRPRNTCVWPCSRPALSLDGSAVDTSGACGPDIARPFTLASAATISFSTSAAALALGPCGPFTTVPAGAVNGALPGGALAIYRLEAGEYFVSHSPVAGTLTAVADASAALSTTCADAQDIAALDRPNIFVAVPPASASWFLPLPSPASGNPLAVLVDTGASASVCASCAAASCADASQPVPWVAGQMLRLDPAPARPFSGYSIFWP